MSCLPDWFPVDRKSYYASQEEADYWSLQEALAVDLEADYFSKRYDIASFVAINQRITLNIHDWLGAGDFFTNKYGLPEPIKKAIAAEVTNICREEESRRREQERKLEMQQAEHNGHLKFIPNAGAINKVFG